MAAATSSSSWLHPDMVVTITHQISFLLTGLSTTLGTQFLFYSGAATGDSYLTQLAQYTGMVLVGLIIPIILSRQKQQYTSVATTDDADDVANRISMDVLDEDEEKPASPTETTMKASKISDGPIPHKSVMKLALLDVMANFSVTMGFAAIGSGMYQVIYSSVVIWCAILTYFLMGRTLSKLQWFAIFGTSAGLALSSLGSFETPDKNSSSGAMSLTTGTLLTMVGTFGYSCMYVYSDHILSKQIPSPLPARVCFTTGIYATVLALVWIAAYTLPRFDTLIQIQPSVSISSVWGMYALVALSNTIHSYNYYELIDRTGNVATGILQGLRAILVYGISHAWYCSIDAAQCFTAYKGCGSILVIGCVLLFTVGGGGRKKK
ncbi:hypothetical protein BDB00DRAFT_794663 [Zychaea mexicana]|uniref:uncharacterized protein n=1 Tax=Zychaea mexicana TaxID=64656 RepID=UPI0022FE5515|nr:uncharacterized protein BDB00DRAFT_794663 [Zychaea mexicana]KAI9499603.1 hypothetical protein BDB00DRAFT_794663 [Zychaea mexicana]